MLTTQLSMGGAERVFNEHSKMFSNYFNVTECIFTRAELNSALISGNKLVELSEKGFTPVGRLLKRKQELREICKQEHIEVCVSHMDGANWLNVLANKNKVRTVLCVHGSLFKDRNRGRFLKKFMLNRIIVPYIYKKADAIVCVSDHIKFELEQLIGKRSTIHSIPNFFDIERIKQLSKETVPANILAVLKKAPVIVSVGRLAPEKNYVSLIDIFKGLKKQQPGVRLFMIGEGPEEGRIIERIRESGLTYEKVSSNEDISGDADIYLLGLRTNPFSIVSHCKVFLLTSYNEGFPMVIGEAMACNVPVIANDCISGPRQILAPELSPELHLDRTYYGDKGILVPAQNADVISETEIDRWVKSILKVLDDTDFVTHMVQNAGKRIQDFSKENIIQKWVDIIDAH